MIGESIQFKGFYATSGYGKNTASDWHLIPLTKIMVNPPQFKSNFVNAEGMTGEVDLSTASGLNYSNRKGTWQFKLTPGQDFDAIRTEMINFLHGGLFKVTLSTDTDSCYYEGRITVDDWKSTDRGDYITLGYNLKPFRYDPTTQVTDYTFVLSTASGLTKTVELAVTRMPSVPSISITGIYGTLTINYMAYTESTINNRNKTVTTVGQVDTSDMVIYNAPGGVNSGTTTSILFTATGTTTVKISYIGGRF